MLLKLKPHSSGDLLLDGDSIGRSCLVYVIDRSRYILNQNMEVLIGKAIHKGDDKDPASEGYVLFVKAGLAFATMRHPKSKDDPQVGRDYYVTAENSRFVFQEWKINIPPEVLQEWEAFK